MDSSDELRQYYQERAPEYEQIYYRDVPDRRRELDDIAAELEKLAAGKKILELACGTGYWTQVMTKRASSITATDISSEMITQAKKKEYTCPVDFVQADLEDPPFTPGSFDLVILGFWLSHQPKERYDQLFEAMNDMLRTDGQIWMIDNNPPAEPSSPISTGTDRHGNNLKDRFLDNGKQFTIIKNYFTEQDLRRIFTPLYSIEILTYGKFYWSVLLSRVP